MIDWLAALDLGQFLVFALVFARVSGLAVSAPVLGGAEVPAQVRALLAFSMALVLLPAQWGTRIEMPPSILALGLMIGFETLVGLVLGLGVMIVLGGIQLAGQIIGQLSGMSLAEVLNPAFDSDVPLISQFLYMFAIAIFLAIGGHRLVVAGLLGSFESMPPGQAQWLPSIADALVTLGSQSFELGIRAAAPATVALLLANIVLGLLTRTLPQLNVLSFGFGLGALATFSSISVALGSIAWVFQDQLLAAVELVEQALGLP